MSPKMFKRMKCCVSLTLSSWQVSLFSKTVGWRIYWFCKEKLYIKQLLSVRVWYWKSKSITRCMNGKCFCKKNKDAIFFLCNYGEVRKRRSGFRFFRTILLLFFCYVVFFLTKIHCHSFLFCRKSVISVSYSGLPQSFNQITEQDTLPLLYKATKSSKSRGKYDF